MKVKENRSKQYYYYYDTYKQQQRKKNYKNNKEQFSLQTNQLSVNLDLYLFSSIYF
jgi:hypothetical protein